MLIRNFDQINKCRHVDWKKLINDDQRILTKLINAEGFFLNRKFRKLRLKNWSFHNAWGLEIPFSLIYLQLFKYVNCDF